MIKAALFDVFGTCVDWRTGVADFVRPMLIERELPTDNAEKIADAWRQLYDPAMAHVRDGRRPYVTLDVIQRENLDIVLHELGLEEHFDDEHRNHLNGAWEALPAWDDTQETLEILKQNMPIAACSNGSQTMMRILAQYAGLNWSMICGADTGRNFKPHSDVYLKSCAAMGADPAETLMVACHADDLDAAASFGLKTAFFPCPKEWGPSEYITESNPDRFDFYAVDFPTLAEQIIVASK
ncbi:MAG: haloacid dehalogenase type II [Pseudomonadota bacterium]